MKTSNTTRYLCAAAQTDRGFRNQLLEKVLDEEHRAISAPEGVDLAAVLRHCLSAKRRKLWLNISVGILFLLAWNSTYRQLLYWNPYFYGTAFTAFFQSILGAFATPWFFAAWVCVLMETWITRYRVIAKSLLKQNYNPDRVKISPRQETRLRRQLAEIVDNQAGNVAVYSGFSPFVGAGTDIGGWSFTLNLDKPKEKMGTAQSPEPFEVQELYGRIEQDIRRLHIAEVSIQDRLFINGQGIREDERFLPDRFQRPLSSVDTETVAKFVGGQSEEVRHYKCFRVIGWRGEIVLSAFLRLVKLRQNLFIEASYFFLPPLKEQYRQIDSLQPKPTGRQLLNLVGETLVRTLFLFPFAIVLAIQDLLQPINRWSQRGSKRRLIRENPIFDYGAETSIREIAASNQFSHYFQKLDKDMYVKIIERQILDSIVGFLDEHNIDTSDLQARQETILNNGVIVNGGSIDAQNLTVGERAKSAINNVNQAVSSVTSSTKTAAKP